MSLRAALIAATCALLAGCITYSGDENIAGARVSREATLGPPSVMPNGASSSYQVVRIVAPPGARRCGVDGFGAQRRILREGHIDGRGETIMSGADGEADSRWARARAELCDAGRYVHGAEYICEPETFAALRALDLDAVR